MGNKPTRKNRKSYPAEATETASLLGGIGTGNVSIGNRGQFKDWEIFNRPGKGNYLPYSFFAIHAETDAETDSDFRSVTRVLESKLLPPHAASHGYYSEEVGGLPRLQSATLTGGQPFVEVAFEDDTLPVTVTLEAFTPFIPLNLEDSAIPGAIVRYRVKNPTDVPISVSVAGSLCNAVGFNGYGSFKRLSLLGKTENREVARDGIRGVFFSGSDLPADARTNGSMALLTPENDGADRDVTVKAQWLEGGWFDGIQDFWDDFCDDGRLESSSDYNAKGSRIINKNVTPGSICITRRLAPGETKKFEFALSWYFPNRESGWEDQSCSCSEGPPVSGKAKKAENCRGGSGDGKHDDQSKAVVRNLYATIFSDAFDVGKYLLHNVSRLEETSRLFEDTLFSSTLPIEVIDAAASTITVLRSPTCFITEDRMFWGWEGCHDTSGCCPGSCTHVWNYAQTVAFLFPELERSMRHIEFSMDTDADGKMDFRSINYFKDERWTRADTAALPPAADGQLGCVVRLYREWKISGDTDFVRDHWDAFTRVMDFSLKNWDLDGDYVLDGEQHNTYDIEFYGVNSMTNSILCAAFKAATELAGAVGDNDAAERYRTAFEQGSRKMDEALWSGEYYIQKLDDVNAYRYQYGKGCLSDQLLGQFLAYCAGLGRVLPEEHVRRAVKSIFTYNFRTSFYDHHNVQRTYALNDEQGLLLCSWPHGGRPKLPFPYSDEVWSGIEYQVASHLIFEGFIDEGLEIVRAVRNRYDGYKRNPWDEVECGHHYARSMASWGLVLALSGYSCDMTEGCVSFSPKINRDDFSVFWSTGSAWGVYRQWKDSETGEMKQEIKQLYGTSQPPRLER